MVYEDGEYDARSEWDARPELITSCCLSTSEPPSFNNIDDEWSLGALRDMARVCISEYVALTLERFNVFDRSSVLRPMTKSTTS